MPRASALRALALGAFIALALIAYFEPHAFALIRLRASENAFVLVLSLATAAIGAKLTLAVPAFGENLHISMPLLLTFAAPYLLRASLWKSGALSFIRRDRLRPGASKAVKPPHPPGIPAVPTRIAVALAAAARARG